MLSPHPHHRGFQRASLPVRVPVPNKKIQRSLLSTALSSALNCSSLHSASALCSELSAQLSSALRHGSQLTALNCPQLVSTAFGLSSRLSTMSHHWAKVRAIHGLGIDMTKLKTPHFDAIKVVDEERTALLKRKKTDDEPSCVDLIRMAGWASDLHQRDVPEESLWLPPPPRPTFLAAPPSVPGYAEERDATFASESFQAMNDVEFPEAKVQALRGTVDPPRPTISLKTKRFARASGAIEARIRRAYPDIPDIPSPAETHPPPPMPAFHQTAPDAWSWNGRTIFLSDI